VSSTSRYTSGIKLKSCNPIGNQHILYKYAYTTKSNKQIPTAEICM
jgi:hypothetical protein